MRAMRRRGTAGGARVTVLVLGIGLIVLVIAQIICFMAIEDSAILQIILVVPTTVAGYAIFYQLHLENNTAKGNFVLTLEREFSQDAVLTGVLEKIYKKEISSHDSIDVVSYLGFFEVINVLLERSAIDLKLIDRLFRMRFFRATMSRQVQEIELLPCSASYQNIYWLDDMWRRYLEKIGEIDNIKGYGTPLRDALREYQESS
jgi:hypothetical protein